MDYSSKNNPKKYIEAADEDIIESVPLPLHDTIITDRSVDAISLYRAYHIIWFVLGTIETMLVFRFIFKMIGANSFSGFTDFIYTLSMPLVAPFASVLPVTQSGAAMIEWNTLIAMVVYLTLAYGITEIIHIAKPFIPRKQKYISRRTRYAM